VSRGPWPRYRRGVAAGEAHGYLPCLCDGWLSAGLLEESMKTLALKVQRFLVSEDGPTAVEYAVMLALIVIVCLTAIQAIGTNASTTFQNIADQLD
jgi:pilus assembly protein Flp/PilA